MRNFKNGGRKTMKNQFSAAGFKNGSGSYLDVVFFEQPPFGIRAKKKQLSIKR